MHSKDFRKIVGKLIPNEDNPEILEVENLSRFKTVISKLKVLGRASPEDR